MQILKFNQRDNSFLNKNLLYINTANKSLSEKNIIYFSKCELTFILNLYSNQVSSGSWRDYSIDTKNNMAVFSIYRHTHDQPMYQVIKISKKGYRNSPDFFKKKKKKIIYKSKIIEQIKKKKKKKLNIKNI